MNFYYKIKSRIYPFIEIYSSKNKEDPFSTRGEANTAGEEKRRTFCVSAAYYGVEIEEEVSDETYD